MNPEKSKNGKSGEEKQDIPKRVLYLIPPWFIWISAGAYLIIGSLKGRLFEEGANSRGRRLLKKEINQYVMCCLTYKIT